MELSETEKMVLSMMFKNMYSILNTEGVYIEVNFEWFDSEALYKLAQKLGIEY